MKPTIRHAIWPIVIALVLTLASQVAILPACGSEDPARETKMGREGAAEVEKEHKLTADPAMIERVERIGSEVAKVANSVCVDATYGSSEVCTFGYKFKVVEDDDVNAFSLPGGYIYVNTGLLKFVQSDHELAGVLAHEVAHAAHHHMVYLLKEQSRMDGKIALLLLAGMLTRIDSSDLGNLLIGAQLVKIARVNGYGQKAELDADRVGVAYLTKTRYNPVGLVTFIERLARDHAKGPQMDMGILQTHPPSRVRAKNMVAQITALGLPISRRSVTKAVKAETESATIGGQAITLVKLGDKVLFEPAPIDDVVSSAQRAEAIVTKVNQLLDSEPNLYEIKVDPQSNEVVVRGDALIVVTDADARLQEKSAGEVAKDAADMLRQVIWQELVAKIY